MMDEKSIDLGLLALSSSTEEHGTEEENFFPSLIQAEGTSSGGYLFNTIKAVVDSLEPEQLYRTQLVEKKVRSEDYIEYTLITSSIASTSAFQPLGSNPATLDVATATGTSSTTSVTTMLRAAKCYGFRNLQNVVRKIGRDANISVTRGAAGRMPTASAASAIARRNAAVTRRKKLQATGTTVIEEGDEKGFDYVEVMACPSGCVNGGGQIAPPKGVARKRTRRTGGSITRMDEEGMPDVTERLGDVNTVEVLDDERSGTGNILSGKEWVNRVEQVYWTTAQSSLPAFHSPTLLDMSRVDPSILPYILSSESMAIRTKMEMTINEHLGDGLSGEARELKRRTLFRTSYRAVEDGEVNGLAVKW